MPEFQQAWKQNNEITQMKVDKEKRREEIKEHI